MQIIDKNILIIETMNKNFEKGFYMLFNAYYQSMNRVASRIIDNCFAEDVVQDVFINIWNSQILFNDAVGLKSFIYGSVRNKCISVLRKKGNEAKYKEFLSQQEIILDYIMDEDLYMLLLEAIDELPENYKETLLRTLKGQSIAEIAIGINVSEDAVKAYKRRAKILLKQRIGDIYTLISPFL